jgi:type III pantothenate kinase
MSGVDDDWLALCIGNSRCHWGLFHGEALQKCWDTLHLSYLSQLQTDNPSDLEWLSFIQQEAQSNAQVNLAHLHALPELWLASVVPSQTLFWQHYPRLHKITLEQIPLQRTYSTLGVDRALAVWGAGLTWGWPILVVDAGTALTFTGADANRELVGGAILPGMQLQQRSLHQGTGALPLTKFSLDLPERWAITTESAIRSGITYTLLAGVTDFIEDWWQQFPDSWVVFTGGDAQVLSTGLETYRPSRSPISQHANILVAPHLMMKGIARLRHQDTQS